MYTYRYVCVYIDIDRYGSGNYGARYICIYRHNIDVNKEACLISDIILRYFKVYDATIGTCDHTTGKYCGPCSRFKLGNMLKGRFRVAITRDNACPVGG